MDRFIHFIYFMGLAILGSVVLVVALALVDRG